MVKGVQVYVLHEEHNIKWWIENNIHVQPLVHVVNGGLYVVEVFGQTLDCFLQMFDPLTVT